MNWRRPNGLPLPPGHSVSGGTLYIPRISTEYQGTYECIVTSERGDFSTSVTLIVTGKTVCSIIACACPRCF